MADATQAPGRCPRISDSLSSKQMTTVCEDGGRSAPDLRDWEGGEDWVVGTLGKKRLIKLSNPFS